MSPTPLCRCLRAKSAHVTVPFQLSKGSRRKDNPTRNPQCVSFLTSRGVWTHILLGVYLHEWKNTGLKKCFSHAGICQVSKPFHCHPQRSLCGPGETPLPFFLFVARCHGQHVLFQGHSFSKRCVKYHWTYKTPGTDVWHVAGQPYTGTRFAHMYACGPARTWRI